MTRPALTRRKHVNIRTAVNDRILAIPFKLSCLCYCILLVAPFQIMEHLYLKSILNSHGFVCSGIHVWPESVLYNTAIY